MITKSGKAEKYGKDATGKSIIIKDAGNIASITDGTNALSISPEDSFEIVAEAGAIESTVTGGTDVENKEAKVTISGIDITAPKIKKVTLDSAEKITVQFSETIENNLTTNDITVRGYELTLDGSAPTRKQLTGSNALKFTVSGDTITITPANNRIKFATGVDVTTELDQIVVFAKEKIRDSNKLANAAELKLTNTTDATKFVDNAKPVILSAVATGAKALTLTYSEKVNFKSTGSDDEAKQFDISKVDLAQTAVTAATAAGTNTADYTINLTFTDNAFTAGKTYSTGTIDYIPSSAFVVQDIEKNAATRSTHTGIKGF